MTENQDVSEPSTAFQGYVDQSEEDAGLQIR